MKRERMKKIFLWFTIITFHALCYISDPHFFNHLFLDYPWWGIVIYMVAFELLMLFVVVIVMCFYEGIGTYRTLRKAKKDLENLPPVEEDELDRKMRSLGKSKPEPPQYPEPLIDFTKSENYTKEEIEAAWDALKVPED